MAKQWYSVASDMSANEMVGYSCIEAQKNKQNQEPAAASMPRPATGGRLMTSILFFGVCVCVYLLTPAKDFVENAIKNQFMQKMAEPATQLNSLAPDPAQAPSSTSKTAAASKSSGVKQAKEGKPVAQPSVAVEGGAKAPDKEAAKKNARKDSRDETGDAAGEESEIDINRYRSLTGRI